MSYTLYVSDDCPACNRVQEFMDDRQIYYTLINVNEPGKNPVEGVVIYPALLQDKVLMAYGDDIITWFDRVDA